MEIKKAINFIGVTKQLIYGFTPKSMDFDHANNGLLLWILDMYTFSDNQNTSIYTH